MKREINIMKVTWLELHPLSNPLIPSVMPTKLVYNYSTCSSNVKLFSPSVGSGQTCLLQLGPFNINQVILRRTIPFLTIIFPDKL